MRSLHSRLGLVWSVSYLCVFLLFALVAVLLVALNIASTMLAGFPMMLMTLPSSLLLLPLEAFVYVSRWYNRIQPPALFELVAALSLLPAALLNAVGLYFTVKTFDRSADLKKANNSIVQAMSEKTASVWERFNRFFWFFFILSSIVSLIRVFLPLPPDMAIFTGVLTNSASIGTAITLGYFAYALTGRKPSMLLGFLGFIPFFSVIGYVVLRRAMKNRM